MAYEGFGLNGAKRPDRNKVTGQKPYGSQQVQDYIARHGGPWEPYQGPAVDDYMNRPRKPKRPKRQAPAVPAPPSMATFVPSPNTAALRQAREQALGFYTQANKALMAQLDAAEAEVQRQYKLKRTKSEKRALKRELKDLRLQKQAARKAIDKAYGRAGKQVEAGAAANEAMAQQVADKTNEYWAQAVAAQAENAASTGMSSEAGAALGVGGMSVGGDVTVAPSFAARQGAADAANQLNLGQIASAEQRALAASIAQQNAARQGELQRAVLGLRNQAISDSFDASNARIAQERAARAAALQNLAMMGIDGRQQNLAAMADVTMDSGSQLSQLRNDWANAVAQAQAADAQARYEAQLARRDAAGQPREVTQAQLNRRAERLLANSPLLPKITMMRDDNQSFNDGNGQPVSGRRAAAELELLIRSLASFPPAERPGALLAAIRQLEEAYGPEFGKFLNRYGIREVDLGI